MLGFNLFYHTTLHQFKMYNTCMIYDYNYDIKRSLHISQRAASFDVLAYVPAKFLLYSCMALTFSCRANDTIILKDCKLQN